MPATFTRTETEIERRQPGTGGRPPVHRKPTGGGGDGDNWDNRPSGRRGPRELLSRYRMSLFFALAGDLMIFVALVSAFFLQEGGGHIDARNHYVLDWHPILIPPILWLNTALLLLSSVTIEMARRQIFREIDVMDEWLGLGRPTVRRAAPWLIATAILGGMFLAGQWMAWNQLSSQGVFYTSGPSSHYFYLITGSHGAHLALGMLSLIAALASLFLVNRQQIRQIIVDCAAWYWHSMGVFWIFLFALLVLGQ